MYKQKKRYCHSSCNKKIPLKVFSRLSVSVNLTASSFVTHRLPHDLTFSGTKVVIRAALPRGAGSLPSCSRVSIRKRKHNSVMIYQTNCHMAPQLFIRFFFLAHSDLHTEISVVSEEADISAYFSPRDAQAEEEISLQLLQHNDTVENSEQSSLSFGKFNVRSLSHVPCLRLLLVMCIICFNFLLYKIWQLVMYCHVRFAASSIILAIILTKSPRHCCIACLICAKLCNVLSYYNYANFRRSLSRTHRKRELVAYYSLAECTDRTETFIVTT